MSVFIEKPICVALLTAALFAVACRSDFSPASEIRGLRVLAVRGEPPTVPLGAQAVMETLAVTPDGGPVALKWALCIYTLQSDALYRCPAEAVLASGEGETLTFDFDETMAERVAPFCNPDSDLAEVIPEGAKLPTCKQRHLSATVRLVASGHGEEIVAVKRIYLFLGEPSPETPGLALNHNPVIAGFEGGPDLLGPGETGRLTCVPDDESREVFINDEGAREAEELYYYWYIAGGALKNESGGFGRGGTESSGLDEQEVAFEPNAGAERVTLFCVIHDGRGGADWHRYDIQVRQ